ncbi:hypothetical protein ERN12_06000 [Rhodobacteraceae bacterium]|nr:hypothetical protein ERN12_06000 [Paracoccaceae bacterium]
MDSVEQAAGEKRVRHILIEPLERRGLAKPSTLTRAGYDAMVEELCGKLAYMSAGNLAALEEQVAASPAGKDKDRMPIANTILQWANDIQSPGDDASPLIRAVFAHEIGGEALRDGWGPELLGHVRKFRRFPARFAVAQIRDAARDNIRRMTIIEENMAAGRSVSAEDERFRSYRRAALAKCDRISKLVNEGAQ